MIVHLFGVPIVHFPGSCLCKIKETKYNRHSDKVVCSKVRWNTTSFHFLIPPPHVTAIFGLAALSLPVWITTGWLVGFLRWFSLILFFKSSQYRTLQSVASHLLACIWRRHKIRWQVSQPPEARTRQFWRWRRSSVILRHSGFSQPW